MKILAAGKVIAEIMTNHSMTLDEAIDLIGKVDNGREDSICIDGKWYYYDDLSIEND